MSISTSNSQVHRFKRAYATYQGSAQALVQTPDSGYAITGYSIDSITGEDGVLLLKTNEKGEQQWNMEYILPLYSIGGYHIVSTSENGYLIAGTSYDDTSMAPISAIMVMKVDSLGNYLWGKHYNAAFFYDANVMGLDKTADGGFVISGTGNAYGFDVFAMKINYAGDIQWSVNFGDLSFQFGNEIKVTKSGNIIIGAESPAINAMGAYLIMLDSAGNELWNTVYDFPNIDISIWAMDIAADGGIFLLGRYHPQDTGATGPFLMKTDSAGNFLWANKYLHDASLIQCFSIAHTPDGGCVSTILVQGWLPTWGQQCGLMKTDKDGNLEWSKINLKGNGSMGQVIRTFDGGFAATTRDYEYYPYTINLLKTDSLGNSPCEDTVITLTPISVTPSVMSLGTSKPGGYQTEILPTQTSLPINNFIICQDTIITNVPEYSEVIAAMNITLYPNPTTGTFTVQSAAGTIEVLDIFGCSVLTTTLPQIDMRGYAKGMYFVRAGEVVRKLVLQ